jgi:hypothetical protein
LPAFAEMPRLAKVDVYETDDEVVVEAVGSSRAD